MQFSDRESNYWILLQKIEQTEDIRVKTPQEGTTANTDIICDWDRIRQELANLHHGDQRSPTVGRASREPPVPQGERIPSASYLVKGES
jgi:hypothetical protein